MVYVPVGINPAVLTFHLLLKWTETEHSQNRYRQWYGLFLIFKEKTHLFRLLRLLTAVVVKEPVLNTELTHVIMYTELTLESLFVPPRFWTTFLIIWASEKGGTFVPTVPRCVKVSLQYLLFHVFRSLVDSCELTSEQELAGSSLFSQGVLWASQNLNNRTSLCMPVEEECSRSVGM